jgi:hypothetical protein
MEQISNPDQTDSEGDRIGDVCDDDDGDGFYNTQDCVTSDPMSYPGAPELADGVDNNCNGKTDEGFVDIDNDVIKDCVDNCRPPIGTSTEKTTIYANPDQKTATWTA